MGWKGLLTSGFTFKENEEREELNYILFNTLLLFDIALLIIATLLRFSEGNRLQALLNFIFVIAGITTFFQMRKSRSYFTPLFYFMIGFSYIIVTLAFAFSPNPIAGVGWFFVLMMIVFFIKGHRVGTGMFVLLLITILVVGGLDPSYTKTQLFIGVLPLLSAFIFMFFSERRNENLRKALEAQKERYAYAARHDPLTRLPNREHFFQRFDHAISEAKKSGEKLAILFIDFDNFKAINDTYGHQMGDLVLQHCARHLQQQIHPHETLARFGGDEFAAILYGAANRQALEKRIRKLIDLSHHPISDGSHTLTVSFCVGCSIYPDDSQAPHQLIEQADQAMYLAKADPKKKYLFYQDLPKLYPLKRA